MDKILKDSVALLDFLNSLPKAEKTLVIQRIESGCMVPRRTVYNWMYGVCRIPQLHKCKIEEIIGENIFVDLSICEK